MDGICLFHKALLASVSLSRSLCLVFFVGVAILLLVLVLVFLLAQRRRELRHAVEPDKVLQQLVHFDLVSAFEQRIEGVAQKGQQVLVLGAHQRGR